MSKPNCSSFSKAHSTCVLGLLSAIFLKPAFSKNGLYFAMTATVSMQGVLAWARVSATSFAPKPMLRYFGCTITRLIVLTSRCRCWMLPFQALLLPNVTGEG